MSRAVCIFFFLISVKPHKNLHKNARKFILICVAISFLFEIMQQPFFKLVVFLSICMYVFFISISHPDARLCVAH